MSVFLDTAVIDGRQVIVDDVVDGANVDTASAHTRGDHDGIVATTEGSHSGLALLLGTVGMHRSARDASIEDKIIKLIGGALAIDENDAPMRAKVGEQIKKSALLEVGLDINNLLSDVLMRAAGAADAEADMALG